MLAITVKSQTPAMSGVKNLEHIILYSEYNMSITMNNESVI